jgi:hypothetical protein
LTKINFLLRFALEVDNSARCFDRSSGVDHLPTLTNDDLGPLRARTSSTTDRGCTSYVGCPTTGALSQGQMSSGASSAVSIQRRHPCSADTGGNSNVSGFQ